MKISYTEWNKRHAKLKACGLKDVWYSGPLKGQYKRGNRGLERLMFDDSPVMLRLWNFVLSENDRLLEYRRNGKLIVGALKDMGTVPVIAYSFPDVVAFYPDGTWWTPCFMKNSDGLLKAADKAGFGESYCPVRAMLGAFITQDQFPIPDVMICSSGAVCDDLSSMAQYLSAKGHAIHWWDIPHRREPRKSEACVAGLSGESIPAGMVDYVRKGLEGVVSCLEKKTGHRLSPQMLKAGVKKANAIRRRIKKILSSIYSADVCVMPALETMMIEVLAIHFCSDMEETAVILDEIEATVNERLEKKAVILSGDPVRVFWVNPVADLSVLNLLEDCGGRVSGADYMFRHAVEPVSEKGSPLTALAVAALSDPMVGTVRERARLIGEIVKERGIEAVIVSRIPGASHCNAESEAIGMMARDELGVPVISVEIPVLTDSIRESLTTRFRALIETAERRRK